MIRKIIKVGSSAAITIPEKSLKELGLKIGDSVIVSIDRTRRRIVIEPART